MTDDVIEIGARALVKSESGEDNWDALDEPQRESIRENVRAVLFAVGKAEAGDMIMIPRIDLSQPVRD